MHEHKQSKPWYRLRNIVLLIVLGMFAFVGYQIYWALTAKPGSSVDYAQKMVDLAWSAHPGAGEADNAFLLLQHAITLRNTVYEEVTSANPDMGPRPTVDFTLLYNDYNPADTAIARDQADFDRRRAYAQQALDRCRELGVFDTLAEAVTKRVIVRPKHEGRLIDALLPELGATRDLARANAARMRQAVASGDQEELVAAFEQSLGMARLWTTEPIIISNLVGIAIAALTTNEARAAIQSGQLTPETLRALAAATDRQSGLQSMGHAFMGEHLFALDTIQWTHTDDGHGDGRRIVTESMRLQAWNGESSARPTTSLVNLASVFYPSKKEMTAKTDEFYQNVIEGARKAPRDRSNDWSLDAAVVALPWNYDLLKSIMPALSKAILSGDNIATELAGFRIMLAIELYRAEHGAPPATLDDLVPSCIPRLPADPYAADARFRYRLLTPPDELGRTYLLYSVGPDRTDDAGNTDPGSKGRPGRPTLLQSTDILINRVEK